MSHRTMGKTRDCRGCRYWSEMIAMSGPETGGQLKAMCLNAESPKTQQYMAPRDTCAAWASGHLGAIDEPGATGSEYREEKPPEPRGVVGYYYLHENGDLIYKIDHGDTAADLHESTFVRAYWPVDPSDREGAWSLIVEALAAGANANRAKLLAMRWGLNSIEDARMYAERVGVKLQLDGTQWMAARRDFINVQESTCAFGPTPLDALVGLAKALGYAAGKWASPSFKELLNAN